MYIFLTGFLTECLTFQMELLKQYIHFYKQYLGIWPRGYKTFFHLAEYEIINAHKYKKYQEIQLFSDPEKP